MADQPDDERQPASEDPQTPVPVYERLEVERLLRVVDEESKSRWPVLHAGCVGCLCVLLGLLSVCSLRGVITTGPLVLIITVSAIAATYFATRLSTSRAQKESLLRLAELNDVKSVPAMLTALAWPDMAHYDSTLHAALVRLLPRLRASDAGLLTWRHRSILRRNLRSYNTDLVVAILRALEQVGNQDDLPLVGSLARGRTRNARQRAIAAAAKECLPGLEARVLEPGHALLRATQEIDSEALLSPAAKGEGVDQALLHPSEPAPPTDREGGENP